MWSEIGAVLGTAVLGFAGGVASWFATSFLGKSFLDFLALRGKVHEEMIFTGNIGPMVAHDKERCDEAADSLRRLGARRMRKLNVSAMWPLRWFFSFRKYDLATAGDNLIGLSNALTTNYDDRVPHITRIEIALKLTRTYTDDDVRNARERKLKPNIG
jgi:hypothetical protein